MWHFEVWTANIPLSFGFLFGLLGNQPFWADRGKFSKVNAGCLIRSIVDDGIHGSKLLCRQDNPAGGSR